MQHFKRRSFILRHPLNLTHLDKVRKTKIKVPFHNYSEKTLFSFFRIYGKIILQYMILRELAYTRPLQPDMLNRMESFGKGTYRTFPQIIESTSMPDRVVFGLLDLYGKYRYRKTKFILIPKGVIDAPLSRMAGYNYFFYKDFTENLYPYWDTKIVNF